MQVKSVTHRQLTAKSTGMIYREEKDEISSLVFLQKLNLHPLELFYLLGGIAQNAKTAQRDLVHSICLEKPLQDSKGICIFFNSRMFEHFGSAPTVSVPVMAGAQ